MSKQVKFRRGTTAQHSVFTGPAGEITVDTDKKCIVVQDGVVAGGIPIAREDRPRGWTKSEVFTSNGTWSQTGKTDLKRIIVECYGGGAGGHSNGHGGGAGGYGLVVLEVSAITTNVTVTVGSGGAINAAGGTSSFGSYIASTGGSATGAGGDSYPGSPSGTGVINMGSAAGIAIGSSNYGGQGGGCGGGGGVNIPAKGIMGSGGGGNAAGSQGCVIIREIYGYV